MLATKCLFLSDLYSFLNLQLNITLTVESQCHFNIIKINDGNIFRVKKKGTSSDNKIEGNHVTFIYKRRNRK